MTRQVRRADLTGGRAFLDNTRTMSARRDLPKTLPNFRQARPLSYYPTGNSAWYAVMNMRPSVGQEERV